MAYACVFFGPVGTAEKLTVRATIATDPNDLHAAVIADIGLTRRNAKGLVEATTEVVILRPVGSGNATLLLDLPNRGRRLWPTLFDVALEATAQRMDAQTRVVAGRLAPTSIVRAASRQALERTIARSVGQLSRLNTDPPT